MFWEEDNIWESNNIIYYIKGIWVNGEVNSNFLTINIYNEINR